MVTIGVTKQTSIFLQFDSADFLHGTFFRLSLPRKYLVRPIFRIDARPTRSLKREYKWRGGTRKIKVGRINRSRVSIKQRFFLQFNFLVNAYSLSFAFRVTFQRLMARQIEAISRLRWQTEAPREFSGDLAGARGFAVNGWATPRKNADNHGETIESVRALRVWRKGSGLLASPEIVSSPRSIRSQLHFSRCYLFASRRDSGGKLIGRARKEIHRR